jgi:hypothetical protein
LRSIAAILNVRAASADPVRVAPVRRGSRSRAWIVVAIVAILAVMAALWRMQQ